MMSVGEAIENLAKEPTRGGGEQDVDETGNPEQLLESLVGGHREASYQGTDESPAD